MSALVIVIIMQSLVLKWDGVGWGHITAATGRVIGAVFGLLCSSLSITSAKGRLLCLLISPEPGGGFSFGGYHSAPPAGVY